MTDPFEGCIDAHVHAAPDVSPRRMGAVELARAAREAGMAGLVLLNHFSDATPQAAIVDGVVEGIEVRGGVKLNRPLGGVNPDAARTALDLGAVKVDLPTQDAMNELAQRGRSPARGVPVMDDGGLRPAVREVIALVADSDAALATGHLAPGEVEAVADAALDAGVDPVIVSHPEHPHIELPVESQVDFADRGALVEYCYVSTTAVLEEAPVDAVLDQAAAVGPDSAILATDFGQPENPPPPEGMRAFVEDALDYGFAPDEVRTMVRDNPRRAYGFA